MKQLRVLLIATALAATACSGTSDTNGDPTSTDAPSASTETTPEAEVASVQDADRAADETTDDTADEIADEIADEPIAEMDLQSFLADAVDNASNPTDQGTTLIAIIEPDGSMTYASNTAESDEIVVGPDSAFRIGSITKVFTSALTLGLVDDGLVDLDAPARDYVSRAVIPDGVTVRDLLGHRSGMANYTNGAFFEETMADASRVWVPEEMVAVVADVPAEFEPGSEFGYSNTNYILLGMLIEEITGTSYHDALRSQIIDPLDMSSTYVDGVEDGPDVVGAYTEFFTGSLEPITADYTSVATGAWSAGAIVSSPADLHLFFTALAAGDLISDELVDEMTTAQDEYGLGLMIGIGLLPDDVYGHGGSIWGFNNFVLHSPATGRTGYSVSTSDAIDSNSTVEAMAPLLGLETIDADALEAATAARDDSPAREQSRSDVDESERQAAEPPPNDLFTDAVVIDPTALPFVAAVDTTGATADDDDINVGCPAPATDASVWYSITPTSDMKLLINPDGSDYSVGISALTGDAGSFELLECRPFSFVIEAEANVTYHVQVFDGQEDRQGNGGNLTFSIEEAS